MFVWFDCIGVRMFVFATSCINTNILCGTHVLAMAQGHFYTFTLNLDFLVLFNSGLSTKVRSRTFCMPAALIAKSK